MVRNRTVVLARRRWAIRGIPYFWFSTLTPHQMCAACAAFWSFVVRNWWSWSARFVRTLIRVPVRVEHDVCDGLDVLIGHGVLEEVADTVDDERFWSAPPEGFDELLWHKAGGEAVVRRDVGQRCEIAQRRSLHSSVCSPGCS